MRLCVENKGDYFEHLKKKYKINFALFFLIKNGITFGTP